MPTYTPEQLERMAAAWQQARTARYADFRASLSEEQLAKWIAYQIAGRELQHVRRWQERIKRPRRRPHNLSEPTWPAD